MNKNFVPIKANWEFMSLEGLKEIVWEVAEEVMMSKEELLIKKCV